MKRTNLRSNPEDAAHFQKHRQAVRGRLFVGEQPESVAQGLVTQGVPLETARRIVWAVQHEAGVAESQADNKRNSALLTLGLALPFLCAQVAWAWWCLERNGADLVNLIYVLLPAGVVLFPFLWWRRSGRTPDGD